MKFRAKTESPNKNLHMWIWKFFRQIFSYFWKNWDISNHICNHVLFRESDESDESSRWCNFTKKNVRHEPKKFYRAPVKYFSHKNFRGPQTPHFADTDLSRIQKKPFFTFFFVNILNSDVWKGFVVKRFPKNLLRTDFE